MAEGNDEATLICDLMLAGALIDAAQQLSKLRVLELSFFTASILAAVAAELTGVQVPPTLEQQDRMHKHHDRSNHAEDGSCGSHISAF